MTEERMAALSARLTEMGIQHGQGRYGGRAWISAKINGVYDLSVRAEIDDDADDDTVAVSVRLNGELLRLDGDTATEFPEHLAAFISVLKQKMEAE